MLRVTLTSLALGLLSFTSPHSSAVDAAAPVTVSDVSTAIAVNASALSFSEKEAAFDDHILDIYNETNLKQKGLSFEVFKNGVVGFQNFKRQHLNASDKSILTVIDFTKSSRDKRLWIIDLKSKKLLFNTLVAHGRNTGEDKAVKFSNQPNSYMSSLGFYLTDATYFGKHGLSLRLNGMDGKYNSNAMARAIVMHGADYATSDFVKRYGRLGRSLGCPAVPQEFSKEIITAIKDKTVIYIHGNDSRYTSDYLNPKQAVETFALEHSAAATMAAI
ncbi:murein L,D-transpeptidase catalytic domain family protein [Pontibacter sp. E15-1]|uniref:murein L,D-transpeptidase catalytic domain family protein n=1 Tax=Pontibacter sp. E15-1 TaxID=2919918 RepID=UPI001F50048F|nr:murein L,D-transpeptidase catalytic domain family protein [Pontibacter sp. E15-1]MCJ8166220.1 murein L,D-transpeptidase catalytic domain family protein [Pontibacter sp. E15-1]